MELSPMPKENLKTETHYNITFKFNDYFESIDIIQKAGDRKAIKVKFFEERWRTPKDTIKLLKKIIKTLEDNFVE